MAPEYRLIELRANLLVTKLGVAIYLKLLVDTLSGAIKPGKEIAA